jgi:RsiW-degrading membrane proteinase PrsW (M82 family)
MTPWVILSGIIAPALFWGGYLYYNDRHKPEPLSKMGIAYLLGFGACWVCLQLYELSPAVGLPADPELLISREPALWFSYAVCVIGSLEEACKFLPFLLVCTRFRAFDEELDGIIYASAIALGFASYENFLHLEYLTGMELYARAIASPLVHVVFASVWGHACAKARLAAKPILWPALGALLVAIFAHGLYDFLATDPQLGAASALVILALWIWRIVVVGRLQRAQKQANESAEARAQDAPRPPQSHSLARLQTDS